MRVDDFLLNVVMMLPLAALLYLVAGVRDRGRAVLVGFLISLVIEIAQAVIDIAWHGNRWADVNDLTSNTVGAWLGFLIFWRVMRRAGVEQVVAGPGRGHRGAGAPPGHPVVNPGVRDGGRPAGRRPGPPGAGAGPPERGPPGAAPAYWAVTWS
jgi:hypothetical protein